MQPYTMNAYELQALRHIFAMTIVNARPGLPRPVTVKAGVSGKWQVCHS